MSTIEIVLIVAASVLGLAAIIYGLCRKASRVSWIGWQVFALFALTFLLDVVPLPAGSASFWITGGVFAAALALDLLIGGLIRMRILKCAKPNKHLVRLSRVSGAVCSLLNIALGFGMFAAAALAVCAVLPARPAVLEPLYASGFWQNFLARHAFDLFIITLCFVFARAGLRLGVIRGIYYLLMFALSFASFVGAILLATRVSFFANWGASLASLFTGLSPAGASVLGHGLFALLFFAILFAVVMVLGYFLHKLLKKAIDCRPVGIISAVLLFLLFLFVFLASMCAVYYGVAYLTTMTQESLAPVVSAARYAGEVLRSSPLSAAFYNYNPFMWLLP